MKFVYRFIRWALRIPAPLVSAEQAMSIARSECERRGWRWGEARAVEELRHWLIWVDSTRPSPLVVVDQQTSEVLKSGRAPR